MPSDWRIALCDERLELVDFDCDADVIGITGKMSQRDRMIELAALYRARGKLVVIGGPYATLNPDDIAPHCDILVKGEIEEIAAQIFADIAAGCWRQEYTGSKVDLSLSLTLRWDLYPNASALSGTIQISHGCPFECEFCDVIQYVGRKQRHKSTRQVIQELERLYSFGYRSIFLADDNFTVYRKRTKELLSALRDWNRAAKEGRVEFSAQVSIDVCRDSELLELAVEAGLNLVFIGIERPNEDSLRETKKRQNLSHHMVDDLRNIVAHGIRVTGGIIVGFDSDGPDIFEMQRKFIEELPIPILTIGSLVAPSQTTLNARLEAEGRLIGSDRLGAGDPYHTNIVPKQMFQKRLLESVRALCLSVYAPAAFEHRVRNFIATYGSRAAVHRPAPHQVQVNSWHGSVLKVMAARGQEERNLYRRLIHLLQIEPRDVVGAVLWELVRYTQVRHMYDAAELVA